MADDMMREQLIEALVAEWMKRSNAQAIASPTEHCASLADAALPRIRDRVAEAWDEGFRAGRSAGVAAYTSSEYEPETNPYQRREDSHG